MENFTLKGLHVPKASTLLITHNINSSLLLWSHYKHYTFSCLSQYMRCQNCQFVILHLGEILYTTFPTYLFLHTITYKSPFRSKTSTLGQTEISTPLKLEKVLNHSQKNEVSMVDRQCFGFEKNTAGLTASILMYNCHLYYASLIRYWIPLMQFVKPRIKWNKLIQSIINSTEGSYHYIKWEPWIMKKVNRWICTPFSKPSGILWSIIYSKSWHNLEHH